MNRTGIIRYALIFLTCIAAPAAAFAHPMGNFSINHYSKISVTGDSIQVRYVIDEAEIPAFQEMQREGFEADATNRAAQLYLGKEAQRLKENLALTVGGRAVSMQTKAMEIIFPPGAGGLPTMKMGFVYTARIASAQSNSIDYRDDNFPSRIGWKEIVAVPGPGITFLRTSVSSHDRSGELSNYPTDLLQSPPQDLEANLSFEAQGVAHKSLATDKAPVISKAAIRKPVAISSHTITPTSQTVASAVAEPSPSTLRANQLGTPRSRFTELMTAKPFSIWFLFIAAGIAAGLGALHALEPGHGKTIVAAYLVGSRGTARHAVLLGIVVTAAHTAGVYLLGIVTLYASQYIVPEQLYPWLGAISGVTVAGLGIFILLRNLTGVSGEHSHADGKNHSHWLLSMSKSSAEDTPGTEKKVSLRELLALGITGGIVPCPAALVVLLSAFSLHRIGFGLFLITSFSFGLALVLVVIGLTMVYTKRFVSRYTKSSPILRYLPLLSSSFMVILGIGIAISAFSASPIAPNLISREKLVPFVSVVLLGLFLGMRHSTDPDHVVAVSTIISRQRSIKYSTAIGLLWGLGHTLTIFLVGSAIIIFGVVIPPRLGLSMEFSVALMLILLGVLNLTGVMRWITERFTPSGKDSTLASGESLMDRTIGKLGVYQTVRPFAIGLVHGLAGSAAVALLVLSTIKSPVWATAYLLVFGAGTMIGMMLMTTAIALPIAYTGRKFLKANRFMTTTSGLFSMAFGLFLVYHIGLVDGLFRATPHWIPQ